MAAALTGDYQFSSEPRTLKAKIYRDQEETSKIVNIMIDKRVVRGNTFATVVVPTSTRLEIEKRQAEDQRKFSSIKEKQLISSIEEERQVKTPEPVEGRVNIEVQTESVPEELAEKPQDRFQEVQTDYYIDRPVSPIFSFKKTGEDEETQVDYDELFDFDSEVDPILEVLVMKSIEIGRMEVLEEAEIQAMKIHNEEFQQLRKKNLNELQRIEGEEIRKKEEAKARKRESQSRKENLKFTHQKYVSRIMAKKFLSQISQNTFRDLVSLGNYEDLGEKSLYDQVNPWIIESLVGNLYQRKILQTFFEDLASSTFSELKNLHAKAMENEKIRQENERLAEIQAVKDHEEKKKKRAQLRIQRKIDLKLKELKNNIEEKIIFSGTVVEKVFFNHFSDIDSRQNESIIGTPGGLFGELLNILSVTEEILQINISQDQMNALLIDFVSHAMKCPVLYFSNISESSLKEFFKVLKPNLSSENIYQADDEIKANVLNFLVNYNNSIENTSLTIMWKQVKEFELREGLIESLIQSFFHVLTLKDLDPNHVNLNRLKVEIKAEELEEKMNVAVIKIFHNNNEDEVIEDRTVSVIPSYEKNSAVFVIHKDAQNLLRNELVYWIKGVKEFEKIDIEVLKRKLKEKADMREEKILSIVAKGLPVFEYFI